MHCNLQQLVVVFKVQEMEQQPHGQKQQAQTINFGKKMKKSHIIPCAPEGQKRARQPQYSRRHSTQ